MGEARSTTGEGHPTPVPPFLSEPDRADTPSSSPLEQEGLSPGVPLLLALLIVVSRWPFRTQYLFNWDAANFALGLQAFNVGLHQPHPPGYPYFVGVGAVFNLFLRDANTALQAESILLQVVAVVTIYRFGVLLFSPRAGLAAGLLLAASVTFWSYGEIALAYPALAAFSALTAYFAYQTAFWERDRLYACAIAYAIGSGFRPDLALFLLPLVAIACWRQPRGRAAVAIAITFGGVLLWLIPTALLSGGLANYWAVLNAYFSADVIERYAPTALGLAGLMVNVRDTSAYLFYALYAEAAVALGGLLLLLWQRPRGKTLLGYLFLLGWAAPMGVFYVFLHIGDPGYVFSLLPPILLMGVGGWYHWLRTRGETILTLAASGLALVLMANALLFFLHQRQLTLPGLRANDQALSAKLVYLNGYNPGEVLVVSYDSYKQFRYYLPHYPYLAWLDTKTPQRQAIPVPPGVRWAVFTDPSVFALVQGLPAQAELLGQDTWAARFAVQSGQVLVYENARIGLQQER